MNGMKGFEHSMSMLGVSGADFIPSTPILMQFAAENVYANCREFASDCRVLVGANMECAEHFGL